MRGHVAVSEIATDRLFGYGLTVNVRRVVVISSISGGVLRF
jgi:hypothetical protein